MRPSLATLCLAISACGDASAPAVPATLEVVAGDGQQAVVEAELPAPLEVRVSTSAGEPIRGQEVTWSVESGAADVRPAVATTDADGIARTDVVLGSRAGEVRIRASVHTLAPATLTARALPDDPAVVAIWAGDDQAAPVGEALPAPLTAAVLDRHGNRVPEVPVRFDPLVGRIETEGVTREDGLVEGRWILGTVPGEQRATVTIGAPADSATFRAVAVAGPPASVERLRGDNQHGAPGTTLRNPLVVRVVDAFGNPVPNAPVTFSSSQGGTFQPAVGHTRAHGETQTIWTLGTDTIPSVSHRAIASVPGGPSASFTAVARDPCLTALYETGTTLQGVLEPGDCQSPEVRGDTSYLDLLRFGVEVQGTWELDLVSTDFGPYALMLPSRIQASGGGGSRAKILVVAAPDSYEIAVSSVAPATGAYTFTSRRVSDDLTGCPSGLVWLAGSVQIDQTLAPDDCGVGVGLRGDHYSFTLSPGEHALITAASTEIPVVLTLEILTNSGYTRVRADTSSVTGDQATIERGAAQFAFYRLTLAPASPGATGSYLLELARTSAGGAVAGAAGGQAPPGDPTPESHDSMVARPDGEKGTSPMTSDTRP